MKNQNFIQIKSDYKQTQVVTGAQINLSIEDARGLYKMSQHTVNGDMERVNQACRDFVRELAKRILFSAGEATSQQELFTKVINDSPKEEEKGISAH